MHLGLECGKAADVKPEEHKKNGTKYHFSCVLHKDVKEQ
jgi:hypothetical protein